MRSRDVIGKKIVRVRQQRFWNECTGTWAIEVGGFELEDGSEILLTAREAEDTPYVHASIYKQERRKQ